MDWINSRCSFAGAEFLCVHFDVVTETVLEKGNDHGRAPRHTENPYCEMVTPLRPFVVQDPSLFSRLPGHKRVSISVSKEMEFLGMPGCPVIRTTTWSRCGDGLQPLGLMTLRQLFYDPRANGHAGYLLMTVSDAKWSLVGHSRSLN